MITSKLLENAKVLNCKQITEKVSENLDEPLRGVAWLRVKFHLILCRYCRRYNHQIEIVAKSIPLLDPTEPNSEQVEIAQQKFRDFHQGQK